MDTKGSRGGDLYDSAMGQLGSEIKGGNLSLNHHNRGYDHATVYWNGYHYSWDILRDGGFDELHGTVHPWNQGSFR